MRALMKTLLTTALSATTVISYANTVPPCPLITGFYSGTYKDVTGLFPNQAYPINLYLTYRNGMVYGYTLKSKDGAGAKYGLEPYAAIWGSCTDNKVTNLYVIKRTNTPCGDPAPGPMLLNQTGPLNLTINYENAMINAKLEATLSPNTAQNNLVKQGKLAPNQHLIYEAIGMATEGVQTCH